MAKNSRILCIPDLHIPYHHPDALEFLTEVQSKYSPDKVVILGDEIDGHSISFHDNDPDLPFTPSSELEKAIWYLKDFYLTFPKADIVESNHGSLIYRRAKWAGIPASVIKTYAEILEAPKGWKWHMDLTLQMANGRYVYFHHGLSKNALKASQNKSMSHVCGHYHSEFSLQWWANSNDLFFAINCGCLIDHKSLAFAYGKNTLAKPILGCAMIIDGIPKMIPMTLDKRGRWSKKIL